MLRLFVDAAWPLAHVDCRWQLLDDAGGVAQQGFGPAAQWPGVAAAPGGAAAAATPCEVVLSADQATAAFVRLPVGALRGKTLLLANAIEDRLLNDPLDYHCIVAAAAEDGRSLVVAIERARMQAIITALAGAGLRPRLLTLDVLLRLPGRLPAAPDCLLLLEDGCGYLVHTEGWLALDACATQEQPPALLAWALRQGGGGCQRLLCSGDLPAHCLEAWSASLAMPMQMAPGQTGRAPANLLQGEFAPPRSGREWLRRWRPFARAVLAALALALLVSLMEWGRLSWRVEQVREEQTALFRSAFPDIGVIVSPALQMQRAVDAGRASQGLVAASDFLSLLADLAAAPGEAQLERLQYEERVLRATLLLPDAQSLQRLRTALAQQDISVNSGAVKPAAGGVRVELMLLRGAL